MAEFNRELLFTVRPIEKEIINYEKGEYLGKYYFSDDSSYKGKDGQHVRFTFNDFCEVVEIFPLAKPTSYRYDNYFQKSYGKFILASKNISSTFKIKYHNKIKDIPDNPDRSVGILINDYNIFYSEKSPYKVQNMVLGQELVNVLEDILKVIDTINADLSKHVHTNVSVPLVWRTEQIKNQLDTIKKYLPNILSVTNFGN